MIYTLFIWTVIACGEIIMGCKHDWRPIGEFYYYGLNSDPKALCEDAARQMGMKTENYRCIKNK